MKITHVLDEVLELNTTAFAINSHVKDYNLCWHINKVLGIELKKQFNTKTAGSFFACEFGVQKIVLVKNKLKKGHLLSEKKKIDFFITTTPALKDDEKTEFIIKLSEIPKILLIFEIHLENEPEAHRLILND